MHTRTHDFDSRYLEPCVFFNNYAFWYFCFVGSSKRNPNLSSRCNGRMSTQISVHLKKLRALSPSYSRIGLPTQIFCKIVSLQQVGC